ncbi:MAG: trimethylamine methyltransferase family protein [Anaerolineales bacterium]
MAQSDHPASHRTDSGIRALQTAPQPHYRHPVHEILDAESLDRIHQVSLEILSEAGMGFYLDDARSLLHDHGCRVEGDMVYFKPDLVEKWIEKAPSSFTQIARNPAKSLTLGAGGLCLAPVYGPPFVRDLEGGRRRAVHEDFNNFVKLAYSSQHINHSGGTLVEPADLPQETRHLDMLFSHIKYSDKPFMGSVTSESNAEDSLEMAQILFNEKASSKNPQLLSLININSPRQFDAGMLEALTAYSQANQACVITPFILSGAMAPVSIAGTVAQLNAEVLAGIVYSQMVNPGAPVVYGSFMTNIDLKSGAPVFGSPESQLALYASSQLSRRYQLPFRSGGMFTSSKVDDAQSAYESMMTMLPAINAHTNLILHAAGWLENGLTAGYEKFMLDEEVVGMLLRFIGGLEPLDDEGMALDSLLSVEPGGHHLGTDHTMAHYREAFYRADLFDYQDFDSWDQHGSLLAHQRAAAKVQATLEEYKSPELEPRLHAELTRFIETRKGELLPG